MQRCVALLVVGFAACGAPSPAPRPAPEGAEPPRLVVLLIVDQLPEWAFEQKRPALTRGFGRLLAEGEWRVGRHPSIATLTGPGHALLGTGEPPARSGIIANEWWSRDEGRTIVATQGEGRDQTSTRHLRVPALGDAIAHAGRGGKAVGVALKNRAALLPIGHHGRAVFYDGATGTWTSRGPIPGWLAAHDAAHPIAPRLAPWTPLPMTPALAGGADARPGEVGEKGLVGATFPHDPRRAPVPTEAVFAMPLGNELVFEIALAALAGEGLGADATPDLLALSLSAHDYIAHGWGHESWEAWDAALRLDASLDAFLAELDRRVGAGRWAMVVTSDHGGSPLPELVGGGRYTEELLEEHANAAAARVLGPGRWIAAVSYPNVYLSPAAHLRPERDAAVDAIVRALRGLPGLATVERLERLAGGCDARLDDARAICLALDPERSGDVIFLPAAGWITEEEGERLATAHGSLHDYDRLVPVLVVPPGRTRHAPATTPGRELPLEHVAPLLATWLGVPSPRDVPR